MEKKIRSVAEDVAIKIIRDLPELDFQKDYLISYLIQVIENTQNEPTKTNKPK